MPMFPETADCVVLLHLDGNLTDSSTYALTLAGTGLSYEAGTTGFGQRLILNGSQTLYVDTPPEFQFHLSTDDFSIGARFVATTEASQVILFSCGDDADNYFQVSALVISDIFGVIVTQYVAGVELVYIATSSINFTEGTEYQILVVNTSGTLKIFVDGNLEGSGSISGININPFSGVPEIGSNTILGNVSTFKLDEFFILKDLALHTSNFTPESSPFYLSGDVNIVSDTLTLSESVNGFILRQFVEDTLTLVESTPRHLDITRTASDTLTLADSGQRNQVGIVSDSLVLTEATTRLRIIPKSVTDTLTLVELKDSNYLASDILTLAEVLSGIGSKAGKDTLTLVEIAQRILESKNSLTDTLVLVDYANAILDPISSSGSIGRTVNCADVCQCTGTSITLHGQYASVTLSGIKEKKQNVTLNVPTTRNVAEYLLSEDNDIANWRSFTYTIGPFNETIRADLEQFLRDYAGLSIMLEDECSQLWMGSIITKEISFDHTTNGFACPIAGPAGFMVTFEYEGEKTWLS